MVKYNEAQQHILNRLDAELSSQLSYHSLQHTLYVMESCKQISRALEVSPEEQSLLLTAAAYHDAGFLNTYANHEEAGCKLARETLPQFNFSDAAIKKIEGMIMATKLPQTPKNKLEQIICDADLFYLGGNSYNEIAGGLVKELNAYGFEMDDEKWLNLQIQFLSDHIYWTDYCKQNQAVKKQQNLKSLLKQRN